ncbi:MAG TPA: hypothetical protein VNT01_04275, partial [Symbiobacteriaceae bacterium]|nr:hypothetical protein [Symbiobacteriaceae bacterium]
HPGPRHEEGQGPAGFQAGGPAAGYSLAELGQPTGSQNAEEVMEEHFDHPKRHTPGHPPR